MQVLRLASLAQNDSLILAAPDEGATKGRINAKWSARIAAGVPIFQSARSSPERTSLRRLKLLRMTTHL